MLSPVTAGITNIPTPAAISNPSHQAAQDLGPSQNMNMAEHAGGNDMMDKPPQSEIVQSSPPAETLIDMATQETDTPPPPPTELSKMIQDLNRERLGTDPKAIQTPLTETPQNLNMRL